MINPLDAKKIIVINQKRISFLKKRITSYNKAIHYGNQIAININLIKSTQEEIAALKSVNNEYLKLDIGVNHE